MAVAKKDSTACKPSSGKSAPSIVPKDESKCSASRIIRTAAPVAAAVGIAFVAYMLWKRYGSGGATSAEKCNNKDCKNENCKCGSSCACAPGSQCQEPSKPAGEGAASKAPAKPEEKAEGGSKVSVESVSREDVIGILDDIIAAQERIGQFMRSSMAAVVAKELATVDDILAHVSTATPEDPLEAHGLTMSSFDELVDRFNTDPEVHSRIMQIIQGPTSGVKDGEGKKSKLDGSVEEIVKINSAMLAKLQEVAPKLRAATEQGKTEARVAVLAAQIIVGAHVTETFDVDTEAVEQAMGDLQSQLAQSHQFITLNHEIQAIISALGGDSNPI